MRAAVLLLIGFSVAHAETDPAASHLKKALAMHQAGQLEAAAAEYQQYLKAHPNQAEVRSNLGAVLVRLGRYSDAIAQYKSALKLNPGNSGIRLNLALAYFKAYELRSAIEELKALNTAKPGELRTALLLADCYLRLGENKAVVDVLRPFEATDDRAVDYVLGTALIRDNQIARGQELIDRLF